MQLSHRISTLAAGLLLSGLCVSAQTTAGASGHWEGSIIAPFGEVSIEIDLAKNSKGDLAGTFTNPKENLKGLPFASASMNEGAVRLLLKAGSGGGTFEGTLSPDAQSLSGDFITADGGYTVPFRLARAGDARIEPAPKSPPINKALEGAWHGTLDLGGSKTQMVLTMSNQSDGTASARVLDVGNGLEIPVAIVQKASSLTFAIKAVGGSYSGVLSADGAELAGTYTEGSLTGPLTFRRGEGK